MKYPVSIGSENENGIGVVAGNILKKSSRIPRRVAYIQHILADHRFVRGKPGGVQRIKNSRKTLTICIVMKIYFFLCTRNVVITDAEPIGNNILSGTTIGDSSGSGGVSELVLVHEMVATQIQIKRNEKHRLLTCFNGTCTTF